MERRPCRIVIAPSINVAWGTLTKPIPALPAVAWPLTAIDPLASLGLANGASDVLDRDHVNAAHVRHVLSFRYVSLDTFCSDEIGIVDEDSSSLFHEVACLVCKPSIDGPPQPAVTPPPKFL